MRKQACASARVVGCTILTLLATDFAAGGVIYVDDDAAPGGSGGSWVDAFDDLQLAIAAAGAGDEIWVAFGTYYPSLSDATASFVMKSGVALYGGFDGSESARSQRDWLNNLTILSGDVGRDDVYVGETWNIVDRNCGHVIDASGVFPNTVIDGFTIANGAIGPAGTPAGDPLMYGSGIYIVGGSPTIQNCTIRDNLAAFASGGGIYVQDGSPVIRGCTIKSNYVHLGDGGGVFVYGNSTPVIEDCQFIGNTAVSSAPDASGGGLGYYSAPAAAVRRCTFENNRVTYFYAVGTDVAYGGGISAFLTPITIEDCVFKGNQATIGSAVICWDNATIINSLFVNNHAVTRPRDPYPEVPGTGAITAYSFQPDTVRVINCAVAYNTGKKQSGLVSFASANLDIQNTIIWGNTGTSPEVIGYWKEQLGGSFDLSHSCVELIFDPPAAGEDPIEPENLPGCIDVDPKIDTLLGPNQWRLIGGSPCIDAGSNQALLATTALDLGGNARRFDDPSTPDTGTGSAPIVDMGPYEFGATPICFGDVDHSSEVNVNDITYAVFRLGEAGPDGDADGNGTVNVNDVTFIIFRLGAQCV